MRMGIYQGRSVFQDPVATLELMGRTAEAAARQGAGLLIFPELFLTGYNLGEAAHRLAEPRDGPSAERAAAIARATGVALLYGYPEREGGEVYNAALLLDADGRRRANYRKTHLFGPEERRLFRPGDGHALAEIGGLKVGVLICYDVEFPELTRSLAMMGADLIAVPTAISPPYEEVPTTIVRARAYENQVFVAYVNHTGRERELDYLGLSGVVGPDGKDLARAGADEETLLVATLDPAAYAASRQANTYLQDRRPELYRMVAEAERP